MRLSDWLAVLLLLLGLSVMAWAQTGPGGGISGPGAGGGGGGGGGAACVFANPTATAGPNAINGVLPTCLRSDAAPAIQLGTASVPGLLQCDGTTTTCAAGIVSAVAGGGGTGTVTSVSFSCGGYVSGGAITTSGTGNTVLTPVHLTGANAPITTNYCGQLLNLDNGSNQIPTIGAAGATGFPIGWFFTACNVNTGTQTITPASGTIGGAATFVLAAGTQASPTCKTFTSDGSSNYWIRS